MGARRGVPGALPGASRAPAPQPPGRRGGRARGVHRPRAHSVHTRRRADHRRRHRVFAGSARPSPSRLLAREPRMSETWVVVIVVGIVTIGIKALGPMLLGGKPLAPRITVLVALLAPALLAAFVAVNTFGEEGELAIDARVPGVLAAAVAIRLR